MAYAQSVQQSGRMLAAEALQGVATATTVRVRQGQLLLTDGPFAETKEQLADAGLVSGDGELGDPSDLIVVLGGPVRGEPQDDPADADPEAEDTARGWVELAQALDVRSSGVVLLAGVADPASGDVSPTTLARSDSGLSEGLSTVDAPGTALGEAATVLALVEQRDGDAGHYGVGADAGSAIPVAP